ncbi:MAG: hypothetical protein EOO47_27095 [Flavobacterium sp.]|nr:MAG: hypothetical protein EOO47_27095 [Flavobacterium sp.]
MINFNHPCLAHLKPKIFNLSSQIAFFAILLILVDLLEFDKYSAVFASLCGVVVWMFRKGILIHIKSKLYPLMKKTSAFLELAYAVILCIFFYLYADSKMEYGESEIYTGLFGSSMLLVLLTEWIRRRKLKDVRPSYEKYFFIPTMFLILLFGMYYINSLVDGY